MTRAEQRRRLKEEKKKLVKHDYTYEQIANIKKLAYDQGYQDGLTKLYDEAAAQVLVMTLSFPIKIMNEKYNWSLPKLQAFTDDVMEEYEKFENGEMSVEDYRDYIYNTVGIKLKYD